LLSFNPSKSFSFNPIGNNNNSAVPVTNNLYVPTCGNNNIETVHKQQYQEYVQNFGQTISYQPVKYNFNTANFLYGEDPTSGYFYSRKMKAIIDFSAYTSFLTKFGIMSDADLTIYIPISEFSRAWGSPQGETYPLAGDIFMIDDSACNRPLAQSPFVFEVTCKDDTIKPVDFMGKFYVWKLTCKRFDYSYEPNAPVERFLSENSGDTKEYGRLPGGENPPDLSTKEYDVDDFARTEFQLPSEQQSAYGTYL
jgi:hypothetical protein